MNYTLAMDNSLLKLFHDFKRGQLSEISTLTIQSLLRLYHPPHITSAAQLKAIGIEDPALLQQLTASGFSKQTAEELVSQTKYKILLSADQSEYPAVNVMGDNVASQFVMTFKPGEERTKAYEWLRALLKDAKNITVVDNYLCDQAGKLKPNARRFFMLLPMHGLSVFCSSLQQQAVSELKKICKDWKIKNNSHSRYQNVHDRYVLIDNNMEVVITSGIDYLFDNSKECTLLVRPFES